MGGLLCGTGSDSSNARYSIKNRSPNLVQNVIRLSCIRRADIIFGCVAPLIVLTHVI